MFGQHLVLFVCEVVGNNGVPAQGFFVYDAVFFQIYTIARLSAEQKKPGLSTSLLLSVQNPMGLESWWGCVNPDCDIAPGQARAFPTFLAVSVLSRRAIKTPITICKSDALLVGLTKSPSCVWWGETVLPISKWISFPPYCFFFSSLRFPSKDNSGSELRFNQCGNDRKQHWGLQVAMHHPDGLNEDHALFCWLAWFSQFLSSLIVFCLLSKWCFESWLWQLIKMKPPLYCRSIRPYMRTVHPS